MSVLRKVEFEQADFMWQYQLRYERDVVAQQESILALEKFPTPASRLALTDILEQEQCFYRVRMSACFCLAKVRLCTAERRQEKYCMFKKTQQTQIGLKFTIVFNFTWQLVPWKVLPNSFYKTHFKETCFDLNIDNALKFCICQTFKPEEFFTFLLTCQPHC